MTYCSCILVISYATPFTPITVDWKLAWTENAMPTVFYVWVDN